MFNVNYYFPNQLVLEEACEVAQHADDLKELAKTYIENTVRNGWTTDWPMSEDAAVAEAIESDLEKVATELEVGIHNLPFDDDGWF